MRIDLIFDDDDAEGLWAYDNNGNLLDSVTASGDGRGTVPFATATITRPTPDIAYVVAGGAFTEGGLLDNLQVNISLASPDIDIKPGAFPNSVNLRSRRGKIPVAILTTDVTDNTDAFDATTVDPTTVLFGSTGTEAVPVQDALEDVDDDGDTDLILHFNTQDTGIQCGGTSAVLTGKSFGGQPIRGTDSIKTIGCE